MVIQEYKYDLGDFSQLLKTDHISAEFIFAGVIKAEDFKVGYNSLFDLRFEGNSLDTEIFIEHYENTDDRFGGYELDPLDSDDWDQMKWYDWVDDMLDLSNKWPKITFIIRRSGEESPDLEMAWFKNGKVFSRKAIITFESPPEGYFE